MLGKPKKLFSSLPSAGCAAAILLLALSTSTSFSQRGRIESGQITSDALANNLLGDPSTRGFRVYLPPSYDSGSRRYPVIYVLHGYGDDETSHQPQVQTSLDTFIRQRTVGEMIAVFVNGANRLNGSFYLSSPVIGDFETYIVTDLVNLIDSRYRTLPARDSRGITGFSMGGWGALHLALKFPATFSVAVPMAGLYDSRSSWADGIARLLSQRNPANLSQFNSTPFPQNAFAALFAGLAPNPDRPSLFTDYPYESADGQLVLRQSVHEKALEGDVQNGDLVRYLQQPLRLNGLRVIHGTADTVVPVSEARNLTNALTTAAVSFEYVQHTGGHEYRPNLALPFLSAHLAGIELYISPAQLQFTQKPGEMELSFSAQAGVDYTLESQNALSTGQWTSNTTVRGANQTATLALPINQQIEYFRVRAENSPF